MWLPTSLMSRMHHHNLCSRHTWFPSSRAQWSDLQSWRSLEWTLDSSQPTQGNYTLELQTLAASNSTHLVPCRGPPWFLLVISHDPRMVPHQSRTHTWWTWCTVGAIIVVEAWHEGVLRVPPYSSSILEYRQWSPWQTYPTQAWKPSSWDTWSVLVHLWTRMTWLDTHTCHISWRRLSWEYLRHDSRFGDTQSRDQSWRTLELDGDCIQRSIIHT
jgi:hypothetical protein